MRVFDCTSQMTKLYLSRVVDSIIRDDIPRDSEERLREQINQNTEELASIDRIARSLSLHQMTRDNRILLQEILHALLEQPDNACSETHLFSLVKASETAVIEQSQNDDAFMYSDPKNLDIYRTVLAVALEDKEVSADEFALLEKLRVKLKISRREHQLLEARLGYFPTPNNHLHGHSQFSEALKTLQTRGIAFYCNRSDDGALVVLPEEVVPGVKRAIGFEMTQGAQERLQEHLTHEQLYRALQSQGLPVSGSKTERSNRLIQAGSKASEVLDSLQHSELGEMCRKLPGVNVSGSKDERRGRIIEYFDSYTIKDTQPSDDPRAVYYAYLEELAARDNQELRSRDLIKNDREMESKFEEATRYLFENKLGCSLVSQNGIDHADGAIELPNGEMLLWDNKGKESTYTFPKSHRDQFKRYIRESMKRVSIFLVIVPDVDPSARFQAMQLKRETDSDTDIAIITARNLKYVAENWPKSSKKGVFDLNLFNSTGILDQGFLQEWMQVLL